MKRNIGPTTLVLLVLAMFVVSMASPSALAQQCSLAAAAGAYGFTGTGTLLLATGAVPIAAAGRLNLRVDGTLSGTEARSVGGAKNYCDGSTAPNKCAMSVPWPTISSVLSCHTTLGMSPVCPQ